MFTGLVEELGRIAGVTPEGEGVRLTVRGNLLTDVTIGESVAINGCCLSVVEKTAGGASFQAGPETLAKTTLGGLTVGSPVNLERSLRLGDRLGGHWVQGHVDGVGIVTEVIDQGDWCTLYFDIGNWARLLVAKGSVAVDGVSLTVVDLTDARFSVALIPHTLAVTTLGRLRVGSRVNIETDVLGKYVARLLAGYQSLPAAAGFPHE